MAEGFASLVDLVAGLRLADGAAEWAGSELNRRKPYQILVEATRALIQSTEATAAHAQRVPLPESIHTPSGHDIAQLCSMRRRANALANTTATF